MRKQRCHFAVVDTVSAPLRLYSSRHTRKRKMNFVHTMFRLCIILYVRASCNCTLFENDENEAVTRHSCLVLRLRRAPGCLRLRRYWQAFTFLLGFPSTRGCSAYGSVLCLPRRCSLRLLLFCTCPALCAGVLWPMPAWV